MAQQIPEIVNPVRKEITELPSVGTASMLYHCVQEVDFGIGSYFVVIGLADGSSQYISPLPVFSLITT